MVDLPGFETIRLQVEGPRAELVLNRPAKRNPLSGQTLDELIEAAAWLDASDAVKVVVVAGAGRSFSAGADVGSVAGMEPGESSRRLADAGRRMAEAIERMRPIAIARIHGHCVGGGVVLAAACDLRVAASDTQFSIPEIDLGIPLAWGGIPRLVRELGPALTKELVMTGRRFSAEEALHAGFLNRVVAGSDLDAVVDELAGQLAGKARLALLSTKRHVNAVTDQMVGGAHAWADADALLVGLGDPEGRAAATAYLEKLGLREPDTPAPPPSDGSAPRQG